MSTRPPVVEAYRKLARDYEARWLYYIDATIRETLSRISLAADARVLDVGCGTGVLLARLSATAASPRLFGVDPVLEMIEIAHARVPRSAGLCVAWAERLPFSSFAFDTVVSTNMLHYVRRPEAALAEMRRVLRPGGRLVLTDWCDDFVACRLCNWWLRAVDPAHVNVYRSEELRAFLAAAGFRAVSLDTYKINWFWGLMTACAE